MLLKKLPLLLILLGLLTFTACEKDEENTGDSQSPVTPEKELSVQTPSQFTGTINEKDYSWVQLKGFEGFVSLNQSIGQDLTSTVLASTISGTTDSKHISIYKGTIFSPTKFLNKDTLTNFFATGIYPFSPDALNGIEIGFTDITNFGETYWSTSLGEQNGHSFEITEMIGTDTPFGHYITIKSKFTCTLYNESGDSFVIKNGEYIGSFSAD